MKSNKTGYSQKKDITLELSAEQEEELREAFDLFDSNGDGGIAARELHVVMQAIGRNVTLQDTEKIVKDIKIENLGIEATGDMEDEEFELDIHEFMSLMAKEMLESQNTDEELIEAFKQFGPESIEEGFDKNELKETMERYGEKMSEEQLSALFYDLDKKGKREVTFPDFVRMMMSK